jgi:hypothetical protein
VSNQETAPKAAQGQPPNDRQIEDVADMFRRSDQKVLRRQFDEAQEFLPLRVLMAASEAGSARERAETIRAEYKRKFPVLVSITPSDVPLVAELIEAHTSEQPKDLRPMWKRLWKALALDK